MIVAADQPTDGASPAAPAPFAQLCAATAAADLDVDVMVPLLGDAEELIAGARRRRRVAA